jgi:diguanylate cyclase (GGDEF)-like protein
MRHYADRISKLSLSTQLAIGAAGLAVVATLAVSLVIGHVTLERVRADAGNAAHATAVQMAETLSRGMFERYRDITIAGSLDQISDAAVPLDDKRGLLEQLQATYPAYAWIGLTDAGGKVLVSTGQVLEGVDVSKRPWYLDGRTAVTVKDVHEAVLLAKLLPNPTGEPMRFVDVATPVLDAAGNRIGVLGAHLSWSWARDARDALLQTRSSSEALEILVLASDGSVLLGPDDLVGQKLALFDDAAAAGSAEGAGHRIETWPDGRTYLTAVAQSRPYLTYPGLGWQIVVREPTATALAAVNELQGYIALIGGAAVLVLGLAGWLASRRVSRPVLAIAAAADRIAQGHSSDTLPVVEGSREVSLLSGSLRALLAKLQGREAALTELNQSLEQRVADRTAVLASTNNELRREVERRGVLEEEREALIAELRHLASRDPLSGAYNRRAFMELATRELKRAQRQRSAFGIIMLDIDHFKKVNDTYGHGVGDQVIRQTAQITQQKLRETDVVCRYGGEEFAVLLIDSDPRMAGELAERVRQAVEALEIAVGVRPCASPAASAAP